MLPGKLRFWALERCICATCDRHGIEGSGIDRFRKPALMSLLGAELSMLKHF